MSPEAGSGDIGFIALGTDERPFIVVQPPVQFQVDVLGERLRSKKHSRFKIAGVALNALSIFKFKSGRFHTCGHLSQL